MLIDSFRCRKANRITHKMLPEVLTDNDLQQSKASGQVVSEFLKRMNEKLVSVEHL